MKYYISSNKLFYAVIFFVISLLFTWFTVQASENQATLDKSQYLKVWSQSVEPSQHHYGIVSDHNADTCVRVLNRVVEPDMPAEEYDW